MTRYVFGKCKYHCKKDGYKVRLIITYPKYNHLQYSTGMYYKPDNVIWNQGSITIYYKERYFNDGIIEQIPKEITLPYNKIKFIYMLDSEGNNAHTRAKG